MRTLSVLDLVDILTFLFLAFWASVSLRRIARGARDSISFVIIVHFFFCGVPLLLDVVFGNPRYWNYPGFYDSTRDSATAVVYCVFVAACAPFWWLTARPGRGPRRDLVEPERRTPELWRARWLRVVLILIAVSPVVVWFLGPDPVNSLRYTSDVGLPNGRAATMRALLTTATMLSVLACTVLLVLRRRTNLATLLCVAPLFIVSLWLNGKRGIVAISLCLVGYVMWHKGYLRGSRLIVAGVTSILLFGGFSYWYLSTIRAVDLKSRGAEGYYEYMRTDFGRDDVIKMAIFHELHPEERRTLEFRGQSMLFTATMYVPRSFWPGKPWPYAVYVTSAALRIPVTNLGWGFTTSVLDEAISNFSWLGLLLGPLSLSLVCRVGDACNDNGILLLTIIVAVLSLSVQLVAFAPLALGWMLAVIWSTARRRYHWARIRVGGTRAPVER